MRARPYLRVVEAELLGVETDRSVDIAHLIPDRDGAEDAGLCRSLGVLRLRSEGGAGDDHQNREACCAWRRSAPPMALCMLSTRL
jgi:hypothetical protein